MAYKNRFSRSKRRGDAIGRVIAGAGDAVAGIITAKKNKKVAEAAEFERVQDKKYERYVDRVNMDYQRQENERANKRAGYGAETHAQRMRDAAYNESQRPIDEKNAAAEENRKARDQTMEEEEHGYKKKVYEQNLRKGEKDLNAPPEPAKLSADEQKLAAWLSDLSVFEQAIQDQNIDALNGAPGQYARLRAGVVQVVGNNPTIVNGIMRKLTEPRVYETLGGEGSPPAMSPEVQALRPLTLREQTAQMRSEMSEVR